MLGVIRPALGVFVLLLAFNGTRAHAQVVNVDRSVRYQTIAGFGAVGGHTVGWEPGPHFDDAFVDLITRDLGATIMRVPIAPDFEPENDNADPNALAFDRFRFGAGSENEREFALVRAVHARGGHRFIATVWTPPGWMKLEAKDSLAVFCRDGRCGGKLNPKLREEFAEYLVAYVRAFRQATGADLYAVSIQNELLFENAFDSCVYSASEYAETLKVVGARFVREKLRTRIFGPEHMGSYRWNDESGLLNATLDDPDVSRYLDAYAVHSYIDGVSPDFGSADGWSALFKRVSAAGKPLWMSETSRDEVSYAESFDMARGLHLALKHGQVSAWVYWTYAKHLVIDKQPTDLYHLLKSYFRHVRPGAVQVGSSANDAALLVTAFSEPDALVVVVINNSDVDKRAALRVDGGTQPAGWQGFRTSQTEHSVALGAIDPNAITLPRMSISTWVFGTPGKTAMSEAPLARNAPTPPTIPSRFNCGCSAIGTTHAGHWELGCVGLPIGFFVAIGRRRIRARGAQRRRSATHD